MILNFKSAMKSEEELRRSFDRLWNGIRNLSFDGMEVWDFIADNWTVQELEEFLSVWNDTSPSERRALFNCPQDTADDISLNLESTLDALRDEALMLIGALVFHDTTQSNATVARLSLGYEFEGYLARTIASLREKLPAPLSATIRKIDESLAWLKPQIETPDLLSDLSPETSKDDAAEFMARLVCHVWLDIPGMSKNKATDYVFQEAKKGDRLFADCIYARRLRDKYGRNESTVAKDAAELHSRFNSWRKKSKKPYTANIFRMLAKESRAKEEEEHIGKHR